MRKRILRHVLIFVLLALLCAFGCPFYRLTGVPCPTCGATRAWICFLKGDFSAAWQYHHLFFVLPAFVFLFAHRGTILWPTSRKTDTALAVMAGILIGYHLLRLFGRA